MGKIRIYDITHDSVVDGPGLRTVVWFSGCNHKCPECHNPELWDFEAGNEVDTSQVAETLKGSKRVTFSGGDPIYQLNGLDELVGLLDPKTDIWIYTGFEINYISSIIDKTKNLKNREFVIKCGPFIKDLRDIHCLYRGSSNQKIYIYKDKEFIEVSDEIDVGR